MKSIFAKLNIFLGAILIASCTQQPPLNAPELNALTFYPTSNSSSTVCAQAGNNYFSDFWTCQNTTQSSCSQVVLNSTTGPISCFRSIGSSSTYNWNSARADSCTRISVQRTSGALSSERGEVVTYDGRDYCAIPIPYNYSMTGLYTQGCQQSGWTSLKVNNAYVTTTLNTTYEVCKNIISNGRCANGALEVQTLNGHNTYTNSPQQESTTYTSVFGANTPVFARINRILCY